MRKHVLPLLCTLICLAVVAACSSTHKSNIIGQWHSVRNSKLSSVLTFKPNGTFQLLFLQQHDMQQTPLTGSYRTEQDGFILEFPMYTNSMSWTSTARVVWSDANTLIWPGVEGTVTFEKVSPTTKSTVPTGARRRTPVVP